MDVAMLAELPRTELVARWQVLYGVPPPKGISRRLMVGTLTYAHQAKQQGGPSAALSRRLARLIGGKPIAEVPATRTLKPGARLVREWNGKTHTVEVVEGGYIWNGTRYRSLSAVACAITGAHWSGPRFFGIGP
ncbi:MAG: DUF2924 domain-containing protein [Alphaproteobacteria bacterium]|nr:DUF2924 domain-containing protein [Alphaproteobacteria bacterium]